MLIFSSNANAKLDVQRQYDCKTQQFQSNASKKMRRLLQKGGNDIVTIK